MLVQIADELVDVAALSWAYDAIEEYCPMAIAAHRGLAALWSEEAKDIEAVTCSAMGISPQTFEQIKKLVAGKGLEDPRF